MIQNSKNLDRLLRTMSSEVASMHKAKFVEPEHVLIAIIERSFTSAFNVLMKLNIDTVTLLMRMENAAAAFAVPDSPANPRDLPPSHRLQEALNIARNKAQFLRYNYVGTEHLLLAFANRRICPAFTSFLEEQGKSPEAIENIIKLNLADMVLRLKPNTKNNEASILNDFGINLNEKQRQGFLDPVIGREKETARLIQILCRRTKNNPVLVGEAGVGKSAIVEGLAEKINEGDVPRALLNKRIISIDVGSLLAGTKYRGEFEERIKRIIEESIEDKNIILFIDELHTVVGGGNVGQNSLDAADLLKPALARGEIQCIGATTNDEYRRYIEKDAALERRFQQVIVNEPSIEETIAILQGVKSKYETFHNVEYSATAIEKAAHLSARYITDRYLPDKAIDIIDESGAAKKIQLDKKPENLNLLESKIEELNEQKQECVSEQNYEEAAKLRDEVLLVKEKLQTLKNSWENPEYTARGFVDANQIAKTISMITNIPVQQLSTAESKRLIKMADTLKSEVVGQDDAINTISRAIQRSRVGISSPDRPIGSFLFLGPTGVGKTLLAKKIAKFIFGKESSLIRIDMSDFMEKHNVSRLVGAPPGYVGFENGGMLTEQIRKNQYSVILFDEIEKAHRDVFNLLLQVLEEGELQDNLGHVVSFRNTIIIMTSNAGSRSIISENQLGFNLSERGVLDYKTIKQNAEEEIKNFLSPEFINRLDDIIVFAPLSQKAVETIFDMELAKLNKRLAEKQIRLKCTETARKYFSEKGYEPSYGARPMRRLIQTEVEDILAEKLLKGEITTSRDILLDKDGEKISFYEFDWLPIDKKEKAFKETENARFL
ncbi:MAG: ATP-dependent Clp protease ATP-binding subunit [Treponemataceae bacterium]